MRKNSLHKIYKTILKIMIAIGVILIYGTTSSLDIDAITFAELFRYWIIGLVMIGASWKLLRGCKSV